MKVSVILPTVTVFLMLLIKEGLGLECYQCNSYLSQKCASTELDQLQEYKRDCNQNATACRIIVQELYYEKDYHNRIIRQCSYEGEEPMECVRRTGTYRYKTWYCHCEGDNCNAAVTSVVSISLMIISLGLVHLARKHL